MKLAVSFPMACLCLYRCHDQAKGSRFGTRVWNLTDRPIDLQIRVGSILRKTYTIKPGSSKRLQCRAIYKAYMPDNVDGLLYHDGMCQPYVWVHDNVGGLCRSRAVKQQYISMNDLRDSSDIKISRDHHRECILVRKIQRPDIC